jgi:hypothetical protein
MNERVAMGDHVSRRDWLRQSGLAAGAWAAGGLADVAAASPIKASEGKSVTFQRRVPLRYEVDVFVAGGGPAGVAAAVSARQQGANVFLAEAHTCLGGMGTAGRVPTFMTFSDGVHFLAAGFGQQVLTRMKKDSTTRKCLHIDNEALKRVYDGLMTEAGARFTFYTTMIAVEVEKGSVAYVVCASPSGLFAVRAKVYVDATGNGDLATWAGAEFDKGDPQSNLMPGTLCSVWSEIDWETWLSSKPAGPQPDGHMLEKAFADGVFTVRDEHLTGMHRTGERLGGGNIGHSFGVDANDEISLTKALVAGRKSMKEYERYYREYLKGFEKIQLVATGSLLGVRETRRIRGDYTLSLDDYKRRATFPDEIGRYCYPIDNHPVRPGKDTYAQHRKEFDETLRYAKGESYGIPYRILTPRGLANVLVAGRCVSADRMVHGSIRVMPGCFITGQAAGVAAAIAADKNQAPRAIQVADLQARLKKIGAYLPNA